MHAVRVAVDPTGSGLERESCLASVNSNVTTPVGRSRTIRPIMERRRLSVQRAGTVVREGLT